MIKTIQLQGEVNLHEVTVTYYEEDIMVLDGGYDFPVYKSEGSEIIISNISGDLPTDFNDYKEDYLNDILELIKN